MNLEKVIEELKKEKNSISEAIAALERLLPGTQQAENHDGTEKRPGRPRGHKGEET